MCVRGSHHLAVSLEILRRDHDVHFILDTLFSDCMALSLSHTIVLPSSPPRVHRNIINREKGRNRPNIINSEYTPPNTIR